MSEELDRLQSEIARMFAAALQMDDAHIAEVTRRDSMHLAETERRDRLHISETGRRDALHQDEIVRHRERFANELDTIRQALETRDLIGQAKGIIIAAMGCSADEAFVLLRKQSQAENRKLQDVAAEISRKAQRRHLSTSSADSPTSASPRPGIIRSQKLEASSRPPGVWGQ